MCYRCFIGITDKGTPEIWQWYQSAKTIWQEKFHYMIKKISRELAELPRIQHKKMKAIDYMAANLRKHLIDTDLSPQLFHSKFFNEEINDVHPNKYCYKISSIYLDHIHGRFYEEYLTECLEKDAYPIEKNHYESMMARRFVYLYCGENSHAKDSVNSFIRTMEHIFLTFKNTQNDKS